LADSPPPAALQELLRPYKPDAMEAYTVGTFVNNVRNKGPQGVEPLA
jgi:putative SOS response-associated peptidase YedK